MKKYYFVNLIVRRYDATHAQNLEIVLESDAIIRLKSRSNEEFVLAAHAAANMLANSVAAGKLLRYEKSIFGSGCTLTAILPDAAHDNSVLHLYRQMQTAFAEHNIVLRLL